MPSLDFDLVIQCSSDLVRAAAFARTYRSRLLLLRSICDHLCPPNNSDISDHSKRDVGFPDKFASYRNSYPVSGFIRGLFVAATHDYLALNRMRWSAFHDLMHDARVPASSISGGRDFNGWYIYNEHSKDRKREWFWLYAYVPNIVKSPELQVGGISRSFEALSIHRESDIGCIYSAARIALPAAQHEPH